MFKTAKFALAIILTFQALTIKGSPVKKGDDELKHISERSGKVVNIRDWSHFHHSWTLPSFSSLSVSNLFKDTEDNDNEEKKLKTRVESLEKSQKEILEILKKITEANKSAGKVCGSETPLTTKVNETKKMDPTKTKEKKPLAVPTTAKPEAEQKNPPKIGKEQEKGEPQTQVGKKGEKEEKPAALENEKQGISQAEPAKINEGQKDTNQSANKTADREKAKDPENDKTNTETAEPTTDNAISAVVLGFETSKENQSIIPSER